MKTKFYILAVLFLAFTFSNAQDTKVANENTPKKVVNTADAKEEVEVLSTSELKEVIAKTSDIKLFLKRERNEENIKYIFPGINKRKAA